MSKATKKSEGEDAMRERSRRDGQPTAEELKQRGESGGDESLAIDWAKVGGETPGQPLADAVEERQAEARADSAPVGGAGAPTEPPGDDGANRLARLQIVRDKFTRLDEIAAEKKVLSDEEEDIRSSLEKESGFQRTAVSAVRKIKSLGSAAAMKKHIENRDELEAIFIKPILEEAEAGQADE